MARGFSEEEAEALVIRGFMDVSIFGLPTELSEAIGRMVITRDMRLLYPRLDAVTDALETSYTRTSQPPHLWT